MITKVPQILGRCMFMGHRVATGPLWAVSCTIDLHVFRA